MQNEFYEFFDFNGWDNQYDRFIQELEQSDTVIKVCIKYIFGLSYQASYEVSRTRLTGFRNAVKNSSLADEKKDEVLEIMTLPQNIADGLNYRYRDKQKEKLKAIDELPHLNKSKYLRDLQILTNMIKDEYANSARDELYYRYLLLLFLQMATGRRSVEIFKLGNFRKVTNNLSKIYFSGQAKIKSKEFEKDEVIIPVLNQDNNFVLFCVEEIRNTVKKNYFKLNNDKFMKYIDGSDSKNKHYLNLQKKLKLKYLNGVQEIRSAYALISENMHNDKMEYRTYISYVLGHRDTDVQTMESYIKHYLKKKNR